MSRILMSRERDRVVIQANFVHLDLLNYKLNYSDFFGVLL